MEEFRDERLGKIMSWMQAWARGYLARKGFKKLQEQRVALKVVQRNLRKYLQLRTWPWYKLWQKVKPLLNVSRIEDEIAVSIVTSLIVTHLFFILFFLHTFGCNITYKNLINHFRKYFPLNIFTMKTLTRNKNKFKKKSFQKYN